MTQRAVDSGSDSRAAGRWLAPAGRRPTAVLPEPPDPTQPGRRLRAPSPLRLPRALAGLEHIDPELCTARGEGGGDLVSGSDDLEERCHAGLAGWSAEWGWRSPASGPAAPLAGHRPTTTSRSLQSAGCLPPRPNTPGRCRGCVLATVQLCHSLRCAALPCAQLFSRTGSATKFSELRSHPLGCFDLTRWP